MVGGRCWEKGEWKSYDRRLVRLMGERVWMGLDLGVDHVKGEESVDLKVLEQEWVVEVWMLTVLVDKVW